MSEWKWNGYYYAIKKPTFSDSWPTTWVVCLVHKDYWEKNKHLADHHLTGKVRVPKGMLEESESTFSYNGEVEEGRKRLELAGFLPNEKFQAFCERHDP